MKQLLMGTVLAVSTFFSVAPQAQASQWGCTVFLCFASPTNPMAIADCAKAILQIRPWRKPTCSAVEVHYQRDVTRMCPEGYEFFESEFNDFQKTSGPTSRTERLFLGNEKFLGLEDICINPRTGAAIAPRRYTVYEARYSAGGNQYNINYIYP